MTTAEQYATAARAIHGQMTEQQCRDSGAHATLADWNQPISPDGIPHRHRPGPVELRAEAARIRTWKRDETEAHYICRHGRDLGHPWGADLMCGECEQQDQWTEADELEAYAAELEREVLA